MKKVFKAALLALMLTVLCTSLSGCFSPTKQIKKVSDLNGTTVAVEMDAIHAAIIKGREDLADCKINYAYDISSAFAMLMSNKADAVVTDYVMAQALINRYSGVLMLDEQLDEAHYGFGFRKNDPVKDSFNAELEKMREDGSLEKIVSKWVNDGEKSLPAQDWKGKNGTIRCAVDPDAEPMCYLDENGDMTGLDMEIILVIAKNLDLNVEFDSIALSELIPNLLAGHTDIIASGLTVTEERLKLADFTDGYLEAGTVAVVKDVTASTLGQGLWLTIQNSFRRTFIEADRWKDFAAGIANTLIICAASCITGSALGTLLYFCYHFSKSFVRKILSALTRFFVLLPVSTWLLVVYYLLMPGQRFGEVWVAVLAFTVSFGFEVFGAFRDSVAAVPQGNIDAARVMGYSKLGTLKKILIPQALPSFFESVEVSAIWLVKDTSLVGFVSVQDIQSVADAISSRTAEPFLPVIITATIYTLLAFVMSRLVRLISPRIVRALGGKASEV